MTFTPYLTAPEYADYGIPTATGPQVAAACRLIDAHLGRPEGLLWSPDAAGQPAYMTGKAPSAAYALPAPVSPGSGVVLTLPGAQFGYQSIGEVVILDRTNANAVEACVVTAASGNTLTLDTVQFAHASAATVEFGLTILEEGTGRVRLSRSPVARILCGFGRYSYSREMRQLSRGFDDFEALLVTNYGQNGASGWNPLDLTQWDINLTTGAIRMPRYDHETTRIHYLAGWSSATLPTAIKQAAANIVAGQIAFPEMTGNIQTLKAGDGTITRFKPGSIDRDTQALLSPYRMLRI